MLANGGPGVFLPYAGIMLAIPTFLVSTLGTPQIAHAQSAPAPVLSCVTEVTGQDGAGKTLVTLPGRFVGTRQDGALIIAVEPSCVVKPVSQADKYADAAATVDAVVKKAKEAGVPPQVADRAGAELNGNIAAAKAAGDDPANQVNVGNNARAKQSAEHPDNSDDAMVAAIAAVAGVCMVASAGICATAAVAILPSILPAKISSKDVQGITSVLNDINQGRPVSPERAKALLDTARKFGKANEEGLAALGRLAETGLKVAVEKDLIRQGAQPGSVQKVIDLIYNAASTGGGFNCKEAFEAANIRGTIQITDKDFVARVVATLGNYAYGAPIVPGVRACLTSYLDSNR